MQEIQDQLSDPFSHLVCDDWLLDQCDAGHLPSMIRFWDTDQTSVVIGYGNHPEKEVYLSRCAAEGVPVYRRCTGGGTVLLGAGVICYSLFLPFSEHEALTTVSGANDFIMERNCAAVAAVAGQTVAVRGCTDLAVGDLKFSGNAQRRRRKALLFHGTMLLHFDLALMDRLLRLPGRRPQYRGDRQHAEFVQNLALDAEALKQSLRDAWTVQGNVLRVPSDAIASLATSRRTDDRWVCLA